MFVETTKGKLPVKYGWKALRRFSDLCEKDMNQVIVMITEGLSNTWRGWQFREMYTLLYVGFWFGSIKEGEECKIKDADEIEDMLDDDPGLTLKLSEVLMNDFVDMFAKEGKEPKKK